MSRVIVKITLWDDLDDPTIPHSEYVLADWKFNKPVDDLPAGAFEMIGDEIVESLDTLPGRMERSTGG